MNKTNFNNNLGLIKQLNTMRELNTIKEITLS